MKSETSNDNNKNINNNNIFGRSSDAETKFNTGENVAGPLDFSKLALVDHTKIAVAQNLVMKSKSRRKPSAPVKRVLVKGATNATPPPVDAKPPSRQENGASANSNTNAILARSQVGAIPLPVLYGPPIPSNHIGPIFKCQFCPATFVNYEIASRHSHLAMHPGNVPTQLQAALASGQNGAELLANNFPGIASPPSCSLQGQTLAAQQSTNANDANANAKCDAKTQNAQTQSARLDKSIAAIVNDVIDTVRDNQNGTPGCKSDGGSTDTRQSEQRDSVCSVGPKRMSYGCDFCDYKTNRNSSLQRHLRVHNGALEFQCTHCNKNLRDRSSLHRHIRVVHEMHKPFKCAFCQMTFALKQQLRVHERRHTGDKPHACAQCGKGYVTRSELARHKREVHGVALSCEECGEVFGLKSQLNDHAREVHGMFKMDLKSLQ